MSLTLLWKASLLQDFENGARKRNLKLSCPAFNRANLKLNSKKTKKEVCCLSNDVIGLLNTLYLQITTCNFWSRIHIYKHWEEREGKGTVAKLCFLFLLFVKYFNHLEKGLDTDNTGEYKGFKKSLSFDQEKNVKTRHYSQSYLFDCHPETLRR